MKKFLLSLLLLGLVTTGCTYAAADTKDKGYIAVNVEASEEYNPTLVKLSFSIETTSKDANLAAQMNKEAGEKAINAVKALIDTTKEESVKTTSYSFNPEYSYKDGTRKLTGYRAYNTLLVTIKDPSKAGKIISTALSNGANSINGLEFILEETNDSCNALMQQAAKGARERADKIAASTGTNVTGIKSINASCSSSSNSSANFRLLSAKNAVMDAAEGASMGSIPVEAGKTKLRAYVNAEFFVK